MSPDADDNARMAFHVVAIAASAGGVRALERLLSALPPGFPAAVVVVQHLDPRHRSHLAHILDRHCPLPVVQARDGDQIVPGTVYVAPPNHHLLVGPKGRLSLTDTELVHFVRPSADLLFESLGASGRDRAIAVVLTGSGSDGAMGVQAIKKAGGTVIAEDRETAEFASMPSGAVATGDVDMELPLGDIAPALVALVAGGDGP